METAHNGGLIEIEGDYDYPPYYPPYEPPPARWGWDERTAVSVVISILCVHAVLLANYIHLQHTQKVQHTSQIARSARLVLFFFMPTIVLAEVIVNAARTFMIFVVSDPNDLSIGEIVANARRYICGIYGMHVAPARPFEGDEDGERGSEEAESSAQTTVEVDELPRPHLSVVQRSDDLQQHRVRWSFAALVRVLLCLVAIAQAVGTISLWLRRVSAQHWHSPLGFDKRNFVAAVSSIGCSVSAIVIIVNRREWSLKPLSSSGSRPKEYVAWTFVWELIIASLLNETPFLDMWRIVPISWFRTLEDIFQPGGLVLIVCVGLLVWFATWAFHDRVRERLPKINWQFVLALPVVGLVLWIMFDIIIYLIVDIVQLAGVDSDRSDGIWDKDPWTVYIPFC